MKPVRFTGHVKYQLQYRGTNEAEITEAIRSSKWENAELDKLECRKEYQFNNVWNGKYYKTKQVRPIFVEDESEIVVITVYSYYY